MALDNLLVQDRNGRPYADERLRARLGDAVLAALTGEPPELALAPNSPPAFAIAPSVTIAERASRRTTVVEVMAADRPGLVASLARAIHEQDLVIHSAHIATYGERAVDVFYLTGRDGHKLAGERTARLREALLQSA
jgi:[protein-PII] uridylyltransferase